MPTWVSIGASLLPDDTVLDCLKSLQKDITDYRDTAAKEYQQSQRQTKEVSKEAITAADKEIEKLFKQVKTKLSKYSNREDAQAYLDSTDFRLNIELKQIVNNLNPKN